MEAPPDPGPHASASASAAAPLRALEVARLREQQEKVVTNCQEKIQHWKKVDNDYNALQERLSTLPDKLSYNIMVPFGPFAFMPGKLVHTNEVTVLLGDNWFAKCSAKQAVGLVEHRKEHVRKTIDDFKKVMKNFESRVEFTEDLQKMSDAAGDIVDIREEIKSDFELKAKHRIAHKPHSKPKTSDIFEADFANNVKSRDLPADKELWSRLEELERQEELLGELNSKPDAVIANGEDITSSEEEKEDQNLNVNVMHQVTDSATPSSCYKDVTNSELFNSQVNSQLNCSMNGSNSYYNNEDDDDDGDNENGHDALGVGDNSIPTIYFSHTVEPKRVRINTGKNTTLKFSEKKEEAKRKRKNSSGSGHSAQELPTIRTPADIYRAFVDVVNGEYVPRKSILKCRSRENSVCSDTSESSAADFDDRRGILRSISCEEATCSDTSESILEEEQEIHQKKLLPLSGTLEAFSGTVIEKECVSPSLTLHPAMVHPVLPTIPERKEVLSEVSEETTKRVSKFKAARMQQKN
ncbi:unconventional prefoldin RPB5 interactor 1 isoform X1 [Manis pentadactyla]|uniref:unconventional prefoldin RPB5 interactor 1 isoform X1 n=3 Tax=Manis pentadactyla TaxID=143292 RepID=UPI00255C5575|nr:unconventional prefoldin RPB5 interactor 1 isoform X1 [Manis pentadactyla]KAI5280189.1 Unconventional Prefoldin Rpb5 Interactor 1 [Manis pentadactyla]